MTHGLVKADFLGSLISPHCQPKTENRKKRKQKGLQYFLAKKMEEAPILRKKMNCKGVYRETETENGYHMEKDNKNVKCMAYYGNVSVGKMLPDAISEP